jgi:hypothetical protein
MEVQAERIGSFEFRRNLPILGTRGNISSRSNNLDTIPDNEGDALSLA